MKLVPILFLVATLQVIAIESAFAECNGPSCNQVGIERIYTNANSWVYVGTDGNEPGLNCTPVSGVYLTLYHTDSNFEAIYSTLLAAMVADRPASLRIDGGSGNCKIRHAIFDRN